MDERVEKNVDSLIVIPNERLLSLLDVDCSMANVFAFANDFVMNVVASCAENINVSTHVNLEFEDRTRATLWDRRIN